MLEGRILISAIMVAIFATAVGLAFTYDPDAGRMPLVIGIPGLLLSAVQLVKELRQKDTHLFTPDIRRKEVQMLLWFVSFVAGLILFGFLYAGPTLVATYLYLRGREKWYVALAGGAFTAVVLYGIFEQFLGLPLFDGLVFQWLFP